VGPRELSAVLESPPREELGEARLTLADAAPLERYVDSRELGAGVLVDPDTGATLAAAMIAALEE
jgi:sulfate adenylyltransferase subunit 1 (EFTu-like GTPase family)